MEEIDDGFKLAEVDLKMRGPGEIYGVKQHGIKEFRIASLSDVKLIETTRNEAKKILEKDSELKGHPALKEKLERMTSNLVEPN
jgi:ATP-dependent DNA helicase RecG